MDFVKVLDFGLVKVDPRRGADQAQLTREGTAAGSPAFLAPETARGGAVDERTDLYGLGCIAYWLVTGQLVFEADTAMDMVVRHVRDTPEPPSARTELTVPPELDRLILDCLAKGSDERPASAAEVERRLADVPVEPWTRDDATRWWERHAPALHDATPAPRPRSRSDLAQGAITVTYVIGGTQPNAVML